MDLTKLLFVNCLFLFGHLLVKVQRQVSDQNVVWLEVIENVPILMDLLEHGGDLYPYLSCGLKRESAVHPLMYGPHGVAELIHY